MDDIGTATERRRLESLDREQLERLQLTKLNALLDEILPQNQFYARKLARGDRPITREAFRELPFTVKGELSGAGDQDLTANLTYPVERYVRFHRTSGSRGRPLAVLDTADDWHWWIQTWQFVLDAAGIENTDRVFMAFSYGPFVGFWSAFDSVVARGALVIPGGGLSSAARLEMIRRHHVTVLFCTPSYALHLAELAEQEQLDLSSLGVRCIVASGEPGGSVPAVRERIESAWNARLMDHAGATEIGPWGYATGDQPGLHINESEFLPEFFSVETGDPAQEGELAELVITNLGRPGCPVIRYRTGDLVRPSWEHGRENRFVMLDGGVLGRADDMLIIRGVNIFPSSLDQILRSFPEVAEYEVTAYKRGQMDALKIEVEDQAGDPTRISRELELRLGLRVEVRGVPLGSLPRYDGKGKRFIDQRSLRHEA